jgi:hypothetical protein
MKKTRGQKSRATVPLTPHSDLAKNKLLIGNFQNWPKIQRKHGNFETRLSLKATPPQTGTAIFWLSRMGTKLIHPLI